jgi:hypothetical protein
MGKREPKYEGVLGSNFVNNFYEQKYTALKQQKNDLM